MYDVIIIGAGHAGVEAALASARLNKKTLLIAGNLNKIASMPCNPSIGGPAKGIIVREIDALGGEMAKAIDKTLLQLKMLNSSKGPAVRALRAQADKTTYPEYMKKVVNETKNLETKEVFIEELVVEDNKIVGVLTESNEIIKSKTVIIASGTYMRSHILVGSSSTKSGPENQKTTSGLSESLKKLGFKLIRLKTGTPPRIKKDSIDYDKTTIQYGDSQKWHFSDETTKPIGLENQVPCYLTYTTEETHRIINENLHSSAMYSGVVEGVGPRYCPSIEDKIVRFSNKERHQIFIEPEGLQIDEMYIQGLSTSFPHHIQELLVHSIPGLENAIITKYAYAIEYDAIDPMQLKYSLESKNISGLFFAGQVNGTSGYEEAACQGLMAGINASRKLDNLEPLILRRDEAYIGVLVDDLITKGVKDPYRLLTSRAEFRLLLRNDNSEARLLEHGYQIGLISEVRYNRYLKKLQLIDEIIEELKTTYINPKNTINNYLIDNNRQIINNKVNCFDFLKRPDVNFDDVEVLTGLKYDIDDNTKEEILIAIKYEGYIKKEFKNAKKLQVLETKKIPEDIDYDKIPNIALEAKDKLKKVKPATISQATRISGVNPSDISVLLVHLESRKRNG
ncbi:MAG: tRNA uridine-5-carboxymethylaminomethyl(34) synthesis enzyme MnmG [Bacilli bacterium]